MKDKKYHTQKIRINLLATTLNREIRDVYLPLFEFISSRTNPEQGYDHFNRIRIILPLVEIASKIEFGGGEPYLLLEKLKVPKPKVTWRMFRNGLSHSVRPFFVIQNNIKYNWAIPYSGHYETSDTSGLDAKILLDDLFKYLEGFYGNLNEIDIQNGVEYLTIMKPKILITDSLFIFPEHEKMLLDAGYEIERLDKPEATEEELIEAVKGKAGYILGGIEKVTDKVIESGDQLKAIVFTGSDWRWFVPGHELATKKGIAVANTPGANSYAVAEYTLTLMLAMTRNIFELGKTGTKSFQTRPSSEGSTVGIIGMGNIGSRLASMLKGLGVKKIIYTSREQKPDVEKVTGAQFADLETLLKTSDIVSLHVPKHTGLGFIDAKKLSLMKDGALIVNCAFPGAIEKEALLKELQSGRLRAAQDEPMDERFKDLPLSLWFNSNSGTAFNTTEANQKASDMAVESIINLLQKGEDDNRVN